MNDTFDVGQGERKKACKGDILNSGGLGPCIAIVIYNPKSKCAIMMHEPNWETDNKLTEYLKEITEELGNKEDLKAFAMGNAIFSDDSEEQRKYILGNRDYVKEELLVFLKKENITTKWLDADYTAEMVFYTGSGKFEFDSYRMDKASDHDEYYDDD